MLWGSQRCSGCNAAKHVVFYCNGDNEGFFLAVRPKRQKPSEATNSGPGNGRLIKAKGEEALT